MRTTFPMLSALLMTFAVGHAQLLAPNDAGVAMGHVHLTVKDVEANKAFWTLLGGKPLKIEGTDVIKFPGILVFLTKGSPAANNDGSVVNHFGIAVPNVPASCGKWKAEGVRMSEDVRKAANGGRDLCFIFTPDGQRIEINEDETLTTPVASYHIHFWVVKSAMPEMQAWYAKHFGATPRSAIPGMRLSLRDAPSETGPTKGRVIDHIGFEVNNLKDFCDKLEARGVKLDKPYSKNRHAGFASAELTDPWGTSIELTEGLNRY